MSFVRTFQRSRPLQVVSGIIFLIIFYYVCFSGESSSDSFTPEEINTMLQNKNTEIRIKKTELTALGLKPPYLDSSSTKLNHWALRGNAIVNNMNHIRLTRDAQSQAGSLFSQSPIQAESFEMEMTFHIHGSSKVGLYGDGMAIWFIDQKSEIGDVFGAKNYFNGVGIFIDTYKNGKRGNFPYVYVMQGNGKTFYDKYTDGFETRLAGCHLPVVNPESGRAKARLVYIKDGYFSLDFDLSGTGSQWKNCVTLSGIQMPHIKYLGLSAETGGLSENVDVIENRVFALYRPDGTWVQSVEDLERIFDEPRRRTLNSGGRDANEKDSKKKSKYRNRLKKAEERIKQRERQLRLEKYGDADISWFKRQMIRVWKVVKWLFICVGFSLACWVAFTIYRVQRQRNRPRTTGLLD